MKISVFVVCLSLCFFNTNQLSRLKPKEGMFLISAFVIQSTALPAYFYDMADELEESNGYDDNIVRTSYKTVFVGPTTTTTESDLQDEWRTRGEHRIKCVDEVGVDPKKIVRLMSLGDWNTKDLYVKKWVLCVLNRMGLMSKEGVFKMDVAMTKIRNKDKEDAESLIDYCLPPTKMLAEEIAWEYVKCHNQIQGNFSAISIF